jgi:DNA-binding NtrC family response regulator
MKNEPNRILVVDDEPDICKALQFFLSGEGYAIDTANSGAEAVELLKKYSYDMLLTDLKMEGMDGLELLEKAREISPSTITVMMTAYASVESAVSAMKKGAEDYIVKPFVNEDVKRTVRRLLEHRSLQVENQALRQRLRHLAGKDFIGDSPAMKRIFDTLEKVISSKSNILLLGESGTGKGMIAEIIHYNSPRSEMEFISINCSAIPETLLESELLGYRKGAFTGADSDKKGLIEVADGGTLFLDEIGDMPPALQAKLLRVIETGEVLPLGDTKSRYVDVRIIAATNKDLREEVKQGGFREDLLYRLDVIELTVPPLRERKEDVPTLVRYYLDKFSAEHSKMLKGVDEDAMRMLLEYRWPGNVRELRNVIERAVLLCGSDMITQDELPGKMKKQDPAQGNSLKDMLGYFERQLITERLSQHGWSKEETARDLGVDLATLYRKMKKLGIDIGKSR